MRPQRFAMIGGIIMMALGLIALVPAFHGSTEFLPRLMVERSYGMFLGLFPMNIFNKVALIGVGLLGVGAAKSNGTELPMSIWWSRMVFWVMGTLTVLGMFHATNTLGGYWPLFGNAVWFHLIFALCGAYYGYTLSMKVPKDRTGPHPSREPLAH